MKKDQLKEERDIVEKWVQEGKSPDPYQKSFSNVMGKFSKKKIRNVADCDSVLAKRIQEEKLRKIGRLAKERLKDCAECKEDEVVRINYEDGSMQCIKQHPKKKTPKIRHFKIQ